MTEHSVSFGVHTVHWLNVVEERKQLFWNLLTQEKYFLLAWEVAGSEMQMAGIKADSFGRVLKNMMWWRRGWRGKRKIKGQTVRSVRWGLRGNFIYCGWSRI